MRRNTRNSLAALFPSRTGSRRFRAATIAGPPRRLRSSRLSRSLSQYAVFPSRSLSMDVPPVLINEKTPPPPRHLLSFSQNPRMGWRVESILPGGRRGLQLRQLRVTIVTRGSRYCRDWCDHVWRDYTVLIAIKWPKAV